MPSAATVTNPGSTLRIRQHPWSAIPTGQRSGRLVTGLPLNISKSEEGTDRGASRRKIILPSCEGMPLFTNVARPKPSISPGPK